MERVLAYESVGGFSRAKEGRWPTGNHGQRTDHSDHPSSANRPIASIDDDKDPEMAFAAVMAGRLQRRGGLVHQRSQA